MMLRKPDDPRRIDRLIDYFGSRRLGFGVCPRLRAERKVALTSDRPSRAVAVSLAIVSLSALILVAGCAKRPAVREVSAPPPTGRGAVTEPAAPEPAPKAVVGAVPKVEPEAKPEPAPAPRAATPAPAAPAAPVAPPPPPPAPPAAYAPVAELADIHFDFDKSDIRPGDAQILERNAAWLVANPDHLLLIEGHCDERGTNAYNLALGDRRAQATRNFLAARGVAARRMTIVSYGEERPQCVERNEACWSKNRRSHFLVKRG